MATALAKRYTAIADSQRTVCFTETPLEHAWMMCEQIPGRTMRFDGYGLASTRTFARRRGADPVWSLDITPGHDWLTTPVNNMVDQVKEIAKDPSKGGADAAAAADVLRLTPSIEQMGKPVGTRKEFGGSENGATSVTSPSTSATWLWFSRRKKITTSWRTTSRS
ncbi:hypothetical protein [Streptomyces pseudogriseolus]|uniref:hypothetical protein n=1 Tax=Streptomyces pseudogriseolus TaxID=36817 RepID=UPI001CE2A654|nr:hypothetical protein [Streptomyces pseudogriseolus]